MSVFFVPIWLERVESTDAMIEACRKLGVRVGIRRLCALRSGAATIIRIYILREERLSGN